MRRTALLSLTLVGCATEVDAEAPLPCRAGRAGCPQSSGSATDPLVHLGRAETSTFIEITDIVAHGDLAYVCTAVRGLSIFDVSSDGAPRRLIERVAPGGGLSNSQFPRCQHVAFDPENARLVITNRGDEVQPQSWLAVYDVANPSSPSLLAVGGLDAGSIEGVAIEGDRIYAATHGRGIAAMRLEGDAIVETARAREENTDAVQHVLTGERVVVAEGEAGLRIYDADLTLQETIELEGSSRDVLVQGSTAYVATSGGVGVVDLDSASVLSEHPVAGTPLDIAELGPAQIVVAEWDALRAYDFSDPAEPVQLFAETVPTDDDFSRVLAVGALEDRQRVFGGEWTGFHGFAYTPASGPEVELSPSALQFGTLTESDARVLVVSNNGTLPLTVHDITGTADVSVDETCFVVEPGRSAAVEVELTPSSSAPIRSAVRVCSDDPDEPDVEVPLSANISGRAVGDPVPSFALQDLEGNTWSTSDLEGKVAVLAYFATF